MILCKNCKHCRVPRFFFIKDYSDAKCGATEVRTTDEVSGKISKWYTICSVERGTYKKDICGPGAMNFMPKK
jgi:hypothetical protein